MSDYACRKTGTAPPGFGRGGRGPDAEDDPPAEFGNDVNDGMTLDSPQQGSGRGGRGGAAAGSEASRTSPDGEWEAVIENYNVFLRKKGAKEASPLSYDGSEGNYYTLGSLVWSPDSKYLAGFRVRPGYKREVHYIESSPADQVQPKYSSREYAKPGDALDIAQPVLFQVAAGREIQVDNELFPNPFSLSRPVWWKDSRGFTFEYNQRGHQLYRVIEVLAETGAARALITEESQAFVDYRPLVPNPRDTGKKVRYDLADGKQIIWGSERDGWEHLYLYDGTTGKVQHQITKGPWVVRSVEKVDEEKRLIWFSASGMYPNKDPYFVNYYRINFDGSGLTRLTDADAEHTVTFSPE